MHTREPLDSDKSTILDLLLNPSAYLGKEVEISGRVIPIRKYKTYFLVDIFNKYNILVSLNEKYEKEMVEWPYHGNLPVFRTAIFKNLKKSDVKKLSHITVNGRVIKSKNGKYAIDVRDSFEIKSYEREDKINKLVDDLYRAAIETRNLASIRIENPWIYSIKPIDIKSRLYNHENEIRMENIIDEYWPKYHFIKLKCPIMYEYHTGGLSYPVLAIIPNDSTKRKTRKYLRADFEECLRSNIVLMDDVYSYGMCWRGTDDGISTFEMLSTLSTTYSMNELSDIFDDMLEEMFDNYHVKMSFDQKIYDIEEVAQKENLIENMKRNGRLNYKRGIKKDIIRSIKSHGKLPDEKEVLIIKVLGAVDTITNPYAKIYREMRLDDNRVELADDLRYYAVYRFGSRIKCVEIAHLIDEITDPERIKKRIEKQHEFSKFVSLKDSIDMLYLGFDQIVGLGMGITRVRDILSDILN